MGRGGGGMLSGEQEQFCCLPHFFDANPYQRPNISFSLKYFVMSMCKILACTIIIMGLHALSFTAADPGFSRMPPTPRGRGGGAPTYNLAKFRRKLCENEGNWTAREGGHTSKILLCWSATASGKKKCLSRSHWVGSFFNQGLLQYIIICNNCSINSAFDFRID